MMSCPSEDDEPRRDHPGRRFTTTLGDYIGSFLQGPDDPAGLSAVNVTDKMPPSADDHWAFVTLTAKDLARAQALLTEGLRLPEHVSGTPNTSAFKVEEPLSPLPQLAPLRLHVANPVSRKQPVPSRKAPIPAARKLAIAARRHTVPEWESRPCSDSSELPQSPGVMEYVAVSLPEDIHTCDDSDLEPVLPCAPQHPPHFAACEHQDPKNSDSGPRASHNIVGPIYDYHRFTLNSLASLPPARHPATHLVSARSFLAKPPCAPICRISSLPTFSQHTSVGTSARVAGLGDNARPSGSVHMRVKRPPGPVNTTVSAGPPAEETVHILSPPRFVRPPDLEIPSWSPTPARCVVNGGKSPLEISRDGTCDTSAPTPLDTPETKRPMRWLRRYSSSQSGNQTTSRGLRTQAAGLPSAA